MTTLQKSLIAATLVASVGTAVYQARQASRLRAEIAALQPERLPAPASSNAVLAAALQDRADQLASQNAALTHALAQARIDTARIEREREQAKRAAALFKELADQATPAGADATNRYPTARHAWVAFGRLGRVSALSKEDASKLSPEEKSALEAARTKALEDLPNLIKAFKHFDAAEPAGADEQAKDRLDHMACLLYGALSLDEQQFGQVYGLMQGYQQQGTLKALSQTNTSPDTAAAVKRVIEAFKMDTQHLLTPEQSRILSEVMTHVHFEAGRSSINFSF